MVLDDEAKKSLAKIMEHIIDESREMTADAIRHQQAIVADAAKIALILIDINPEEMNERP